MKISLLSLFAFAVVTPLHAEAPISGTLFAPLEVKWPQNRTFNIVFHGHSVPSGYHKTPEIRPFDSYPHLFHVRLKEIYRDAVINVIVTAIGGEDSVAGAARFEADVMRHKPDLVFIDYALNDRRKPLPEVEAAWRAMVASSRKHKVPVVLMTPTGDASADLANPDDPLRQRADLIRRVAAEEKAPLADVSAAWLSEMEKGTPQDRMLSQPNHPNRRGHEVARDAICECLGLESPNPQQVADEKPLWNGRGAVRQAD